MDHVLEPRDRDCLAVCSGCEGNLAPCGTIHSTDLRIEDPSSISLPVVPDRFGSLLHWRSNCFAQRLKSLPIWSCQLKAARLRAMAKDASSGMQIWQKLLQDRVPEESRSHILLVGDGMVQCRAGSCMIHCLLLHPLKHRKVLWRHCGPAMSF